jgi:hypothetical protein
MRAKNSYEGHPTEFAGSTQIPKKIIGTSNLTKISQKNCVSYLKSGKEENIRIGTTELAGPFFLGITPLFF